MSALPQLKDAALSLEDRVGILTFKRDDVRNALTSTEIATDIVNTIAWANASMDISVLIITGEGSAFSAGGNIKTMGERSKAAPHLLQQAYKSGIQRIPLALQDAEIPVIAAVNGPALGGGRSCRRRGHVAGFAHRSCGKGQRFAAGRPDPAPRGQ